MTNNKGYVRGSMCERVSASGHSHHSQKGEPGYDTWLTAPQNTRVTLASGPGHRGRGAGLVYLPVESPTGDYYGGHRRGNNLYGESLCCLDLITGKKKWHYPDRAHPIWDFDLSAAPILADITVGGRKIKSVAVPTKQGILYVFDRVTGTPVAVRGETVEKGDVPGEWYSPTQPIPTKPAALCKERHVARRHDRLHAELKAEAPHSPRASSSVRSLRRPCQQS